VREIWGDLASLVADQSEKLDIANIQVTERLSERATE
jgi:hypothetical protein